MSLIEMFIKKEPASLASVRDAFEEVVPWIPIKDPVERVAARLARLTEWNMVKQAFMVEVIGAGNFEFDPRELVERTLQTPQEVS